MVCYKIVDLYIVIDFVFLFGDRNTSNKFLFSLFCYINI